MLILGPLGFAVPWVLAAMFALPVLWLILRALPPVPRRVAFPGTALLKGLDDRAAIAVRTPWWLLVLRTLAIAALIAGVAGPVWKPSSPLVQEGPLIVVLDAGWAAAPDWAGRQNRAAQAIEAAQAAGQPVALLIADGRNGGEKLNFANANHLDRLKAAIPVGWDTTYPKAPQEVLADAPPGSISSLWLSDGLDHPGRASLLDALEARGPVAVVAPSRPIRVLSLRKDPVQSLSLISTDDFTPDIRAIGIDPQGVERELARLTPGEAKISGLVVTRPVPIDLPVELRNRVTRYEIEGEVHAGAVVLSDDRLKRSKVGLVDPGDSERLQLLSSNFYLRRALEPIAELAVGGLDDVLLAAPDVIILADAVGIEADGALADWVKKGGLLIRFAGPRIAAYDQLADEPLLPVQLRQGGRDIGGALSWGDPRGLAPFDAEGPFAGLGRADDMKVRAQLLAQPGPELAARSIALLEDRTPMVTRQAFGEGQLVLFHVTANAEWSDLPLTGLFVQMLERLIATSGLAQSEADFKPAEAGFWTAESVLDGFGRRSAAPGEDPIPTQDLDQGPSPGRPAGLYASGENYRALNTGAPFSLATWPGVNRLELAAAETVGFDLKGWLIAAAVLFFAIDALTSARLMRRGSGATALAAAVLILSGEQGMAQQTLLDPKLIAAAEQVSLAYVVTGDDEVDRTSQAGLRGLSAALTQRTSIEPGIPVAIDLDSDDLSVLTFLYWPITTTQALPSPQAYLRLNNYLRSGGMILFDTRDADLSGSGTTSESLQKLAEPLDLPQLAIIPKDHVLTRSFYLINNFPGRWAGDQVWVEAPLFDARTQQEASFRHLNDGVSPVVIGGNDWAAAWAIDENGFALYPVGGEGANGGQRELAYRFGINLITYVLTGNYKSDQVHVPELLGRLRREKGLR